MSEQLVEPIIVKKRGKTSGELREQHYRYKMKNIDNRLKQYEEEVSWFTSLDEEEFRKRMPQIELGKLEEAVDKILDDEGITGTDRIKYKNYARKLWGIGNKYGFIKSSKLNAIREEFRSDGANERILRRIEQVLLIPIKEARAGGRAGGEGAISE
jgi:hypothetical protein